jgi:glycosyltransferase involved in cell wall biosynthesis
MNGPLVSVIMPAYNAESHLKEAIDSVLGQTYTDWELIIANDGSTDATPAILRSYTDPRIKKIDQPNKGVSAARNAAMALMNGKYFTFLDADDLLPEESLAIRVRFAEANPSVDFIGGSVCYFNAKGIQRTWMPGYKGDPFQAFIRINETAFCNPSLFLRKRSGIKYSFKEGMSHVEDLLFFATVASQEKQYYDHVNDVVYHYRVTDNSAMSNLKGLEKGYWTFYETVKGLPGALPRNIRYLKWRIIRIMILSYLAAGRLGLSFGVVPKIFTK